MKRTVICVLSLLLLGVASTTNAYAQKPTLAVLVVGLETDAASDAFASGIGYEVTQKGLYELVTAANNTAVKTKLKELRDKHAEGKTVDTVGLAAWGRANGLDFVQLVVENDCDITTGTSLLSGREQVAQVVSCGTTKYSGRSIYRTRFVSQEEMLTEMVFVVGGVFEMGCKSDRDNKSASCYSNETKHWVKVDNFYIGKYEVTQALWKRVMGSLPSGISGNFLGDDKPIVLHTVSYDDLVGTNGFFATLNAQTGKNYRLPTEAEWEYAARGCTGGTCENFEYSGDKTIGEVAWYASNRLGAYPQPVGTKRANGLGIYDLSGNVWEWCSDWYDQYYGSTSTTLGNTTQSSPIVNPTGPGSGSEHVLRGGSWNDDVKLTRLAYRWGFAPNPNIINWGFRLVLPQLR
jgi:formylglycine-generating enzyme required for sulfatase activity